MQTNEANGATKGRQALSKGQPKVQGLSAQQIMERAGRTNMLSGRVLHIRVAQRKGK